MHAIHYVTSVSQSWRKVLAAARQISAREPGTQLELQPPRLSHLAEKAWADQLLEKAQERPIVVAAQSELALLRLLRKTKAQQRLRVYVLSSPRPCRSARLLQELKINDEGEFIDRWPEGFFDGRFEEVF